MTQSDYSETTDKLLHHYTSEPITMLQSTRRPYGKGLKRDITKEDMQMRKKLKESETFFNFSELSKELDEIETCQQEFQESDAHRFFTHSQDSRDSEEELCVPLVYHSLNNSCIKNVCFELGFRPIILPAACSTRLNSTDLEVLNISSVSFSLANQRRVTM